MEAMSTITSRRSIRSYTGESISDSDLQTVLKAANAAPVGMGKYENAHLTVIQDPELLREIEASAAEALGRPGASIFYGAPTYIAVSAKPYGDALGNIDYANTGIIVHSMALAAPAQQAHQTSAQSLRFRFREFPISSRHLLQC